MISHSLLERTPRAGQLPKRPFPTVRLVPILWTDPKTYPVCLKLMSLPIQKSEPHTGGTSPALKIRACNFATS